MQNDLKIRSGTDCQIRTWPEARPRPGILARMAQRPKRLKRILSRRIIYLRNLFFKPGQNPIHRDNGLTLIFDVGDWVRVRSRSQIQATLDNWNRLKGCVFMPEMEQFCGTNQRIFKKVEKFLDERDYLIKRAKGLYILDGVMCSGTIDFGPCDRSCFFFWREEWLESVKEEEREFELNEVQS